MVKTNVIKVIKSNLPQYARCEVRFNDDITTEENIIALYPYDNKKSDERIFFYCNDIDELMELTKENNGEDFMVVEILEFLNEI